MSAVKIRTLYRPFDEELLEAVCRRMRKKSIAVSMLPRFGFSGARLYIVTFEQGKLPYVFKVAPIKKADEEYEALKSMEKVGVADCGPTWAVNKDGLLTSSCGGWGGILYPHAATDTAADAEKSTTLRERLFSKTHPLKPAELSKILMEVYQRLHNPHSNLQWKVCKIAKAYDWYFRGHRSKVRIKQILGHLSEEARFRFLGAEIYNPLNLIKDIPAEALLPISNVHGDLHPDNVVLHRFGAPHLIDFAWAKRKRDVLVDFVLMENSMRFRDFPRTANFDEQLEVDMALLKSDSFDRIPLCVSRDPHNHKAYQQLASTIFHIRKLAKATLKEHFSAERYFFCQFIVLYGLLCYEIYEPYTSVRALGLIGDHLQKAGWDFLKS